VNVNVNSRENKVTAGKGHKYVFGFLVQLGNERDKYYLLLGVFSGLEWLLGLEVVPTIAKQTDGQGLTREIRTLRVN